MIYLHGTWLQGWQLIGAYGGAWPTKIVSCAILLKKTGNRLFQIVDIKDPYQHMLSIHNADVLYDYTKPWVTHVSFQYYNAVRAFGAACYAEGYLSKTGD